MSRDIGRRLGPRERSLSGLGPERLAEATRWRYAYLFAQGGLSLVLYLVLGIVLDEAAFSTTAVALGVVVIAQALGDFGLSQAAVVIIPNPDALGRPARRRTSRQALRPAS